MMMKVMMRNSRMMITMALVVIMMVVFIPVMRILGRIMTAVEVVNICERSRTDKLNEPSDFWTLFPSDKHDLHCHSPAIDYR